MNRTPLWLTGIVTLSIALAAIANFIATDYFRNHWSDVLFDEHEDRVPTIFWCSDDGHKNEICEAR
jgi:hypothetical protein